MDQRFVSPSPHQQNSCVEAPWYLEVESFFKNIYLFIKLCQVLVVACEILRCSPQTL